MKLSNNAKANIAGGAAYLISLGIISYQIMNIPWGQKTINWQAYLVSVLVLASVIGAVILNEAKKKCFNLAPPPQEGNRPEVV